jgi:hypothetical protein
MVVQITPIALANIGWRTYIIFAVLNFSFLPVIYIFYPETKGLELEDVDMFFADSDSVRLMDRARRGHNPIENDSEFGGSTMQSPEPTLHRESLLHSGPEQDPDGYDREEDKRRQHGSSFNQTQPLPLLR